MKVIWKIRIKTPEQANGVEYTLEHENDGGSEFYQQIIDLLKARGTVTFADDNAND